MTHKTDLSPQFQFKQETDVIINPPVDKVDSNNNENIVFYCKLNENFIF